MVNADCPSDQLTDGTGKCVPMAGVNWTRRATEQYWYWVASSADGTKLVATAQSGYIYTSSEPTP